MATLLMLFVVMNIVIGIHEWGHYRAARHGGMEVSTVCSGIGPLLFKRVDAGGTSWQLRLLPVGGYVIIPDGHSYPYRAQAWMILGGPLVNILAYVLCGMVLWGSQFGLEQAALRLVNFPLMLLADASGWLTRPLTLDYWVEAFQRGSMVHLHQGSGRLVDAQGWGQAFLKLLLVVNLLVALFNLLPVPPLDGGRLLLLGLNTVLGPRLGDRIGTGLTYVGIVYLVLITVGLFVADLWVLGKRLL